MVNISCRCDVIGRIEQHLEESALRYRKVTQAGISQVRRYDFFQERL